MERGSEEKEESGDQETRKERGGNDDGGGEGKGASGTRKHNLGGERERKQSRAEVTWESRSK
jgi:hypothetical protein